MRKSLPLALATSWLLSVGYGHTVAQTLAFARSAQQVDNTHPTKTNNLVVTNQTLKQTLLQLKEHYGVDVLFEESVVAYQLGPLEPLNLNARLETNLNTILRPHGLRFKKLRSGAYLILPPKNSDRATISLPEQPATTAATGPVPLAGLTNLATVQLTESVPTDVRISGRVTGETGEGLPGVSVVVKGSPRGTTSDAQGRYQLNIPNGSATLVFSFVGYVTQEQAVNNKSVVDVQLVPDNKSLNEVVVVGYGQVKKSDLTGAVATVPVEEIRKVAVTSLDQALQGRAAGVQITQNSGAPGGTTSIRIRGGNSIQGDNEPLYVIDGIPFKNDGASSGGNFNVLSTLNPSDIESISVLKDASSTAIYGSRGSNGVVIITTKRGKAGKSTITLDAYYGVQNVRRKYPLLNGREYAQFVNDANTNEGRPAVYTQAQVDAFGVGTDWQDEIFQQAPIQNYQLSFSGGDEKTQYAIGGGYFKQGGLIVNSDFDRYSFRINLDRKLTSKIKIGNSLTVNRTVTNQARSDGDLGSAGLVTIAALQFPPILPVRNADGTYLLTDPALPFTADNPVALARDNKNRNTAYRIFGSVFGDYQIIDGLNLRVSLGMDGILQKQDSYLPRSVSSGLAQGGSASIFNSQSMTWLNENLLTYTRTFNSIHNITALLGYTQQANRTESNRSQARNFVNDNLGSGNLASGSVPLTPESGIGTWGLQSYLARINYGYKDKYLLTASFRSDGSSRFGANKQYGYFPSAALAWRVSEEAFLKNNRVLNDLKLRATYGSTGNQDGVGNYPAYSLLATQNYVFGNTVSTGLGPNQIANPDLSWETTTQADLGVDVGFLNNRITLTADVYLKRTKDLLLNVTVPSTSGFSSAIKNLGKVENKGVELSISSRNIDGAFKWSTDLNFALNRNKVLDIGGTPQIFAGNVANIGQGLNSGIIRVGEPLGSFFGYVTNGLYQTADELTALTDPQARKPGDRKYLDLNGDKKIDDNDRTIIGRAQPKFLGGISNTFSYKGVELTAFFQGVYGNNILNANRYELEYLNATTNQDRDVLNRWTPTNTNTDMPRASTTRPANRVSTRQIEDGSYLRLKNIQLAYNLPASVLNSLKIQSVRVYVTAQNYLTWTSYSGYDPEVNRFGQDSRSQGFDYASYPSAKTILFGLNVGF
ncbi:SusC/RagA family TonB-linked outer membrane protein [Spirosoma endophyticum]|uniref:TonB-linked outer membrane protein, SusC/RagA family n=1 Tax=Spirosoma endophyticum TaxID=662367 RepID=A0A1I1HVJ0_9BACT|nr:TonB-dependent receptor [Spirosoma endophyticum]SFC28169.1 TonB-linked outer membrane protein, SusC/RagA family [Spirosoma endophyticum]